MHSNRKGIVVHTGIAQVNHKPTVHACLIFSKAPYATLCDSLLFYIYLRKLTGLHARLLINTHAFVYIHIYIYRFLQSKPTFLYCLCSILFLHYTCVCAHLQNYLSLKILYVRIIQQVSKQKLKVKKLL